jgi:hypothetical protein
MDMGVDGDDNLTILEAHEFNAANTWLLDRQCSFIQLAEQILLACGIQPKLSIFTEPTHADYLSGYFYPVGDTFIHGPKIYRPLIKSGWSTHNLRNKKRQEWIYSNAVASRMDWSHIPILRNWTAAQERLLTTTPKYNPKFLEEYSKREHVGTYTAPDLSTYLFVQEVTGLTLTAIRTIEAEIDSISDHCAYHNPDLDDYIRSQLPKRHG